MLLQGDCQELTVGCVCRVLSFCAGTIMWLSCDCHTLSYTQNMMYDTAKVVFARVPKINDVEIRMPNIHYYVADLLKLPNSGEVSGCIWVYTLCIGHRWGNKVLAIILRPIHCRRAMLNCIYTNRSFATWALFRGPLKRFSLSYYGLASRLHDRAIKI